MLNQSRLSFIEELEAFVSSKQKILDSVLDTLGWTEESMKDDVKVCCPVNPGHWIPESTLPSHKEICEMVKNGYQKEELEKQPPDSAFFYEKTSNAIPVVIDRPTLEKALSESSCHNVGNTSKDVPKTVDRWSTDFTPDQRHAIYDFIIKASKAIEKPQNVTIEDLMIDFEKKEEQGEKPKSELEILAEMRDYKRRRQSYRAKNVHITKKSYTEVMREVIENQTNYLMETRKFENSEVSRKNYEDSVDGKRKYNHDYDDNDSSGNASPKSRDHHSRPKRDYDSKHHHSRHKSSKHYSPKSKKHKRDRSKSRSPSRHKHKKSHKKKSHE